MHARLPDQSRYDLVALPAVASRMASLENPAIPLEDADVWSGGGWSSAAGETVTPQAAMRLAPFWQAVTLISGDIAKLPLDVFRRVGKDREPDPAHPARELVRYQPNNDQTAYEFWQDFVAALLVWRNAYALIVRSPAGRPIELLPLLPDRTAPERIKGRKWYVSEIDGRLRIFDQWEVLHVRGLSFNGAAGLELCEYARDSIGRALARQGFQSKFFERGGRIGGLLELPQAMPKPIRDKVEGGFRESYESPDAAFRTVVLRDGAKFHAAQASWRESQLLEAAQEDVREVARLFNCPPHKLGDMSRSSYSSLEQENRSYYDNCLSPWMVAIKQGLRRKLLTAECRAADCHFFDYNVGAISWADVSTVSSVGNAGILAGWLSRNEVRRWFNLSGVEGLDEHLVPVNMQPATQAGGDAAGGGEDGGTVPPADPGADRAGNDRPAICYRGWCIDHGPADDAGGYDPRPDTAAMRAALELMQDDAGARFVNRLRTAACRACKNARSWEQFLGPDGLGPHLDVGRRMLAPASAARAALGLPPVDIAGDIVERFTAAARALPLPVTPEAVDSLLADSPPPPTE